MSNSNNLGFAYLQASQAQKHVTVNEALRLLDAMVNLIVVDRNLTVPPGSPTEGDVYIPATSSTGDWASHDKDLAFYADGAWQFVAPKNGWRAWVQDENQFVYWSTDASPDNWVDVPGGGGTSIAVDKNGTLVGTRGTLNLIEGTNVTLDVVDDSVDGEIDITVNALDVSALTSTATAAADSLLLYDADGASHIRRPVSDFLSDQNLLTTANEGAGNGLDADTVDGMEAAAFAELAAASNTFTGDIVVQGDLTISGTTTTVDTQNLVVSDNIIVCNNDVTGTPTEDAGLEIERGTSTNAQILWNETADEWQAGQAGSLDTLVLQSDADATYADQSISFTAGIGLNGGGDLSTNRTLDLDISGLGAATVVTGTDSVLAYDTSGSAHIRRTFGDVIGDLNILTSANEGSGNGLDADTVDGIEASALVQTSRALAAGNGLSGGGDLSGDRSFDLALQELSLDAGTVLNNADWLTFVDATDNAHYRITVANFISDQNIVLSTDAIDADTLDGLDSTVFAQLTSANFTALQQGGASVLTTANEGPGNGLDADTVDGKEAASFAELAAGSNTFAGDLVVQGNLTISGTMTTVDTQNLVVSDNIIVCNNDVTGAPSENGGLEIERGTSTNAQILWNETSDKWQAGIAGSLDSLVLQANADAAFAVQTRTVTAGVALTGGGDLSVDRTLDLDISGLGATTAVAGADSLLAYDASGTTHVRRTLSDVISDLNILTTANEGSGNGLDADTLDGIEAMGFVQTSRTLSVGSGLSGGGDLSANRSLDLDIANLTVAASFISGDKLLIWDTSAAAHRKIDFDDLPGSAGGLFNILEDATPQLGADLEANGFDIKFDSLDGIRDANGNEVLLFEQTTSAVDYFQMKNATGAGTLILSAEGTSTDIDLDITSKGAGGNVLVDGSRVLTVSDEGSGNGLDADTIDGIEGAVLLRSDVEDQSITGGATVTTKDQGTKSSGTFTMDFGDRPIQKIVNGGAFTLAPPSGDGTCILHITNNGSAGAVTTSGWSLVDGDVFTTTDTDEFVCTCIRANAKSVLTVKAI